MASPRFTQRRNPPAEVNRMAIPEANYLCPELHTRPARPGADRAIQHPSRVGDRLRWPDGRETDLNGLPIPKFVKPTA